MGEIISTNLQVGGSFSVYDGVSKTIEIEVQEINFNQDPKNIVFIVGEEKNFFQKYLYYILGAGILLLIILIILLSRKKKTIE
jgi:uncharacterized protein YneR